MSDGINWGLAVQQPNFAGGYLQSYQAGKQLGMETRRQNALAAWSQNPDDPAATNALLAADPQTGLQLITARKEQADIQRAADARHMLSLALGGSGVAQPNGQPATPQPNALAQPSPQPGSATPQPDDLTVTAQRPKPTVADIAGLDPALAKQFVEMTSQLDEAGRKRVADQQDALGSVAMQIAKLPYAQREQALQDASPFLQQHGVTPQMIDQFDPNDANLQSVINMSAGTKALLTEQTAVRGQDLTAATARRGQDMTAATARRGQDISHADKMAELNGGGLDPDSVEFYAQKVAAGFDLPQLGMGKAAARARQMILNRAAAIQKGGGMSGADSGALHADIKTTAQGLADLTKRATIVNAAEGAANKNADLALQMGRQNGNGNVPLFNAWRNLGGRATGDPAISKFNAAVETFANEYSSVMGKGTPTDSLRQHAHDMINTAQSPQQFEGVIHVLKQDMANVKQGMADERSATMGHLKGGAPSSGPVKVSNPQDAAKLAPGTLFTTPDGRTMRKR